MKLLSALIILLFVSVIYSQTNPSTLKINVDIYDQFPLFNNNFQTSLPAGKTTGLVKPNLNSTTRVPELVSLSPFGNNLDGVIINPHLFKYFFSPQTNPLFPGRNFPLKMDLEFTYDSTKKVYVYNNQKFFPIDKQGFDTDVKKRIYSNHGEYHNYHFCMKMNTAFTYKGFEVFSFQGDDDVWVYINNKLVIDIGGVHNSLSASVDTTKLGLTVGKSYNFDLFFCERRTVGSTIKIETNLLFVCPFYDYCGVCQGNGSSCCNPLTTCNDNNACTIDSCPSANTSLGGSPVSKYCNHTPKVNPNPNDVCNNYQCNPLTGNFDSIPIKCQDRSSECLSSNGCNSTAGCQYKSACNGNVCNVPNKCSNGTCIVKTSEQCGIELDGQLDKCKIYSCDPNGVGCIKQDKCKQSEDKCQVVSCEASTGNCITSPIQDPLSGEDKCSIATCNPLTGEFDYNPVVCTPSSNPCIKTSCNSTDGQCYNTQIPGDMCDCGCADQINKCQVSFCTPEGVCQPKFKAGINDNNPCTFDSCDPCTGVITHMTAPHCLNCNQCSN
ncbi:hypothetical protein RB653_000025 [Dictyostelium firmibasis]|uniref:PA14 domain-containing protein n=1 Tax=Dictyostelium firmibasis TaxID=79012 RepID=A0AAN7U243_9MYCE